MDWVSQTELLPGLSEKYYNFLYSRNRNDVDIYILHNHQTPFYQLLAFSLRENSKMTDFFYTFVCSLSERGYDNHWMIEYLRYNYQVVKTFF